MEPVETWIVYLRPIRLACVNITAYSSIASVMELSDRCVNETDALDSTNVSGVYGNNLLII